MGLRTLSRVSVVRDGVAEKIVDEYGSLQELMDDISEDPARMGDFGVNNPAILADSLYRMTGTKQGNAKWRPYAPWSLPAAAASALEIPAASSSSMWRAVRT